MEARTRVGGVARSSWVHLVACVVGLCAWAPTASGQGEAYYFATAGVAGGEHDYVDRWCGPDMLPYTEDDIDLPERGNIGGTWGFSWIDSDGDGSLADAERIFVVIRRGDDDMHTFSTRTYAQYGVLAEAENWIDYHEARNKGPSATLLGDPGVEGSDFELNDRAGSGETGWESASNYYWYNNAVANQRGWGGSKYYFEHRNGVHLDEIEGFNKWQSFQNNMDDPTTPAIDERGNCRDSFMRSAEAVTKGLMIPLADIPGLADGDLDPLFGWYSGDMAKYVREVLGPKLDDEKLSVFENTGGCGTSGLPATHLMILQIECPIAINASGDCGSVGTAEALAAYWGIEPITPGQPETDAVYRVSHILLLNDDLTAVDQGVPNVTLAPDDGVLRNLWVQDDFWRDNPARIGRYVLGGSWAIQDDTSRRGCGEMDKTMQLPGDAPGFFEAPLGIDLDPARGDIHAVAEVAQLEITAGSGATLDEEVKYQLVLTHSDGGNTTVVAWAEFGAAGSSVHLGGTLDADGRAVSPASSSTGPGALIQLLDPLEPTSSFPRFVLRAGPSGVKLLQVEPDEYVPNRYEDMDTYAVLASLAPGIASGQSVNGVRFTVSAGDALIATAVDGFAVFSDLAPTTGGGNFVRGNTNNDAKVDISDGIFLLNHLFLGGDRWVCEEGADANSDGKADLSDAVFLFGHLFLGGPTLGAPYPDCGPDPGGSTCPQSSCNAG